MSGTFDTFFTDELNKLRETNQPRYWEDIFEMTRIFGLVNLENNIDDVEIDEHIETAALTGLNLERNLLKPENIQYIDAPRLSTVIKLLSSTAIIWSRMSCHTEAAEAHGMLEQHLTQIEKINPRKRTRLQVPSLFERLQSLPGGDMSR